MRKKSNERLGMGLMAVALLLAVAAWTFSPSLGITAIALFFIGAHLFYTERLQQEIRLRPNPRGRQSRRPTPPAEAALLLFAQPGGNHGIVLAKLMHRLAITLLKKALDEFIAFAPVPHQRGHILPQ